MQILKHDLPADERTRPIFNALPRTPRIVDVGCGIRPCPAFPCEEHVCIEPHHEYVGVLRTWEPTDRRVVIVQDQVEALAAQPRQGTTVLLLDVIEHLEKPRGLQIRDLLEEFDHAVVFTPFGWHPQSGDNPDAWGMNGGEWQRHRSGWRPGDFKRWHVRTWMQWNDSAPFVGAMLAIR